MIAHVFAPLAIVVWGILACAWVEWRVGRALAGSPPLPRDEERIVRRYRRSAWAVAWLGWLALLAMVQMLGCVEGTPFEPSMCEPEVVYVHPDSVADTTRLTVTVRACPDPFP